jgi:hypothetical protein
MFVFKACVPHDVHFVKNNAAACFEIANHSFASFLSDVSNFFSLSSFKEIGYMVCTLCLSNIPVNKSLTHSNLVSAAAICTVSSGK